MPTYITRQRQILIEFLNSHPDTALSAQMIADGLKNENISVSAIYRNLSTLEKDGLLIREPSHKAQEAMFRYIGSEHCRDVLHLSCKKCGRTYHMEEDTASKLISALSDNANFTLDRNDTVLYGVCGGCKSSKGSANK